MATSTLIAVSFFLSASSFVLLIFTLVSGRKGRLESRLHGLSGKPDPLTESQDTVSKFAQSALPKMGTPLMPTDEEERTRLQTRLTQAGLYGRQAMVLFLGVKMLLMIGPVLLGLLAGFMGLVEIKDGLIGGGLCSVFGMIGPSFWLDRRKTQRQTIFRRSLPDALDVLVICLEAGLSFAGALRRVAGELRTAHPVLANELNIVQREMQLGRTAGEALRQFADRADLEEIRSLAAVVLQTERFGASLVNALRVHAETLRVKRMQYAEEMAQKAAVKILFPTLLCIFPGIFIVILGPGAIRIIEMFATVQK
jgi:tight adherence protein C